MIQLPSSTNINIDRLERVFDHASSTYKYFWFLSFLEILKQHNKSVIGFNEIVSHVIIEAWKPIFCLHLQFSKEERLYRKMLRLKSFLEVDDDITLEELENLISTSENLSYLQNNFSFLQDCVPHAFLYSWLKITNKKSIEVFSILPRYNCPYFLSKNSGSYQIHIDHKWVEYLTLHYEEIRLFIYEQLSQFLSKFNSDKPNIYDDLLKLCKREYQKSPDKDEQHYYEESLYPVTEETFSSNVSEFTGFSSSEYSKCKLNLAVVIRQTYLFLLQYSPEDKALHVIKKLFADRVDELYGITAEIDTILQQIALPDVTQELINMKFISEHIFPIIPKAYHSDLNIYIQFKVRFEDYLLYDALLEALPHLGLPDNLLDTTQKHINEEIDNKKKIFLQKSSQEKYDLLESIATGKVVLDFQNEDKDSVFISEQSIQSHPPYTFFFNR